MCIAAIAERLFDALGGYGARYRCLGRLAESRGFLVTVEERADEGLLLREACRPLRYSA